MRQWDASQPYTNITVFDGANFSNSYYGQWLNATANLSLPGDLQNQTLCTNLTWATGADYVTWQINLTIPSDATSGAHTATITFIASQVA